MNMDMDLLAAPKKIVDGLMEVFQGFAQMFEGVSEQLELLAASAVETEEEGKLLVLYCCSASRPAMEGQTAEDEKEVQTETLSLSATALPNGYVKAKTSVNTSDAVYNAWYDAVYEPQQTAVEPEPDLGTDEVANG